MLKVTASGDSRLTDLRSSRHPGRGTSVAVAELNATGGEPYLDLLLNQYFHDLRSSVEAAGGCRFTPAIADAVAKGSLGSRPARKSRAQTGTIH